MSKHLRTAVDPKSGAGCVCVHLEIKSLEHAITCAPFWPVIVRKGGHAVHPWALSKGSIPSSSETIGFVKQYLLYIAGIYL